MKGEVHAHVEAEPRVPSHGYCARTPMGDMPEYVEGDVKLCPHGKVFRWTAALEGYDRWSQIDPLFENKEWRAARRAIRGQEGKLMPPLPPPRVGGYPATRPVPSGLSGVLQETRGDGQRIISVKKDDRTGAPERGKNALMVVLQDCNRLGFERTRTFTVELDPMPGEAETDFRARLLKAAMRKLETLPKDGRL